MKVSDLIALLKEKNPDSYVVVDVSNLPLLEDVYGCLVDDIENDGTTTVTIKVVAP